MAYQGLVQGNHPRTTGLADRVCELCKCAETGSFIAVLRFTLVSV